MVLFALVAICNQKTLTTVVADCYHLHMAKRTHPFKLWIAESGYTYADVAALCESRGRETSDQYIKQVAIGFARPSYDLAKFLSEDITRGAVGVEAFMEWPVTRSHAA